MVAAGGGGGAYYYQGYAGGLYKNKENAYAFGKGQVGFNFTVGSGAGGGGYFGGLSINADSYQGYGGTSYVSGAEGYFAISEDSTSDNVILSDSSIHYSGIEFTDIELIDGNSTMPGKNSGYTTGSQGHGYAKFTLLPQPSGNNFLSDLKVKVNGVNQEYTPTLDYDNLDYYITYDTPDITEATIVARPEDSKATITGTGIVEILAGENIYPIEVIAENGDVRTYKVHITRPASDNPYPNDIIISGLVESLCSVNDTFCKLDPVEFNKDTNTYRITVPHRIKQLWFDIEKGHPYQVVTGEGKVSLEGGENEFTLTITSEDGNNTSTYKYIVTRDMTGNTDLSRLEIIDPEREINYDPDVLEYYLSVPNDYTEIKEMIIETDNKTAIVTGTGEEYLNYGNNVKTITVTAENGDAKNYEINIYREYNLDLKDIVSDKGTLNPTFSSAVREYTIDVPSDVSEITFIAFTESNKVTVAGNGTYQLNYGENEILFTTSDPDNHKKVYKVKVNRENNGNNYIKELTVNGIINPVFDKLTNEYTIDIRENVNTLDLGVVLESDTATYEVLNNSNFSKDNNPNKVTIRVTADNGDIRDYILNVRLQPDEFFTNRLLSLTVNPGTLSPEFNPDINNYIVSVENSVSEITIDAVKENERSTITYNGGTNNRVPLSIGRNVIEVKVTDQNGKANSYYLIVYRAENNDATLKNLTVKDNTFNPIFSPIQTKYNMTVSGDITDLDITAIPTDSNSTVEITGDKNLVTGTNTVSIKVTAPDGKTTKTYTITVNKVISTNNYLSDLNVSGYTFDKTFVKTNQGPYIINVPSNTNTILVNATPEVSTTIVTGDGAITLTSGKNVITVSAVSESGDVRPYTIVVNKSKSSDSSLKDILLSDEALDPTFNSTTFEYTITVPEELESITVTGIPNDPLATVTGNDTYSIEGNFTISLEVTAEDGVTTRTIKVKVTRMKDLISITPSETNIIISKGEEKIITYTLNPTDTNYQDVEWVSSDETIATVDQDGKITGVN